jgi:hypothetical protein
MTLTAWFASRKIPAATDTTHIIDAIRALHHIAIGADGILFCAHCCLNRVSERRFSCYANHTHRSGNAPCPTLEIIGDPA